MKPAPLVPDPRATAPLAPLALVLLTAPAAAQITAVGGDAELLALPPASVKEGDMCDSDKIRVFAEQSDTLLVNPVAVDALASQLYNENGDLVNGNVPAGFRVSSFFIHFDPCGLFEPSVSGWVTFDRPIIAVIEADGKLKDSDFLQESGTNYPGLFGDRGYELGLSGDDHFTISADRLRLDFTCKAQLGVDQLRVLTAAGAPHDPVCRVEAVVVHDTSNSMAPFEAEFTFALGRAAADLYDLGVDVRYTVYGISETSPLDGVFQNLSQALGTSLPGGPSLAGCMTEPQILAQQWGVGTAIAAAKHPWRQGYRRIVVPVSDDGPGCSSIVLDPCSPLHVDAALAARDECWKANAACSPLLAPAPASPSSYLGDFNACVRPLAESLAKSTAGVLGDGNAPGFDAESFFAQALAGACECGVPSAVWSFDALGNAGLDASGRGNHGVVYAADIVAGVLGNGVSVDGTDAEKEFEVHTPQLDFLDDATVVAWIRPEGPQSPDGIPANCREGTIVTKGGNYWLQVKPDLSGLLYQNEYSGQDAASCTVSIPAKVWTHVAAVRRRLGPGSFEVTFYVNGVAVPASDPLLALEPAANTAPVTVGTTETPDACEFSGRLDEVTLYGCARSGADVLKHYLRTRPLGPASVIDVHYGHIKNFVAL